MILFPKIRSSLRDLEFYFPTNPALKRRAIVIASLRDGQTRL